MQRRFGGFALNTVMRKFGNSDFSRLFNFRDERSRGRSVLLLYNFFICIASNLSAGTFSTGFLTANGIDIVRVGIIGFIPYIAWVFGPLSPKFLSRFRRRRTLLLCNHIFFYFTTIVATTVMPSFVTDPAARTVWFGILLFLGHSSNALIGSGATAWHINFLPDGADRNIYFSYLNLTNSFVGTAAAIGASVLADSLAGSPRQYEIIVAMRIISFVLFLAGGALLYLIPSEYPYPKPKKSVTVHDIITVPLHSRKFLLTVLIGVFWYIVCNLNSGTWVYFTLNTVGVSYVLTYTNQVACALGNVFLLRWWRGLINRYSWFRMLFLGVAVKAVLEFSLGFVSRGTIWVYILVFLLEGVNLVGTNLIFANLFYLNLPKENTDVCAAFWNLALNFSVLIGSMLGTWFISLMGSAQPLWYLFGSLPFYSSQLLVWIKAGLLLLLCGYIRRVTPEIRPETA